MFVLESCSITLGLVDCHLCRLQPRHCGHARSQQEEAEGHPCCLEGRHLGSMPPKGTVRQGMLQRTLTPRLGLFVLDRACQSGQSLRQPSWGLNPHETGRQTWTTRGYMYLVDDCMCLAGQAQAASLPCFASGAVCGQWVPFLHQAPASLHCASANSTRGRLDLCLETVLLTI